jgi:hypothetical protein
MKREAPLTKPQAADFVKNLPSLKVLETIGLFTKGCVWIPVWTDCLKSTVTFVIQFWEPGTVKITDFHYRINNSGWQKIGSFMGELLFVICFMLHRMAQLNFHCPIIQTGTSGSKSEDHSSLERWKYLWELEFCLHTFVLRYTKISSYLWLKASTNSAHDV